MSEKRQRLSRYRKRLEQWRETVAELHERLAKADAGHAHAKRFLEQCAIWLTAPQRSEKVQSYIERRCAERRSELERWEAQIRTLLERIERERFAPQPEDFGLTSEDMRPSRKR